MAGSFVELSPGKLRVHAAVDLLIEAPGKKSSAPQSFIVIANRNPNSQSEIQIRDRQLNVSPTARVLVPVSTTFKVPPKAILSSSNSRRGS